jgi:predicted RecA/RadA family phage recombinase
MRNYIQKGENLTLPAPYNVASGAGVLVGNIFGVAAEDALSGANVDIVTEGVFTLPKTSALAISVGDAIYWHDDTKVVNKTAASGKLIGAAVSGAANPSPTVNVRLNGIFGAADAATVADHESRIDTLEE